MDYRAVRDDLGTIEDLRDLATTLRQQGISLTLTWFSITSRPNTSGPGTPAAVTRSTATTSACSPTASCRMRYERTLPEVFPDSAPGSFTYDEESHSWVWTTFNTWQWDLNWRNPEVFYEFADLILLAGQPRRRVPATRRDRVHLQADGHQLPEPARGARRSPRPFVRVARIAAPGVDLQGRGDRRARRPRPRTSAAGKPPRQGQRPRLPQLADGADLVDARARRTPGSFCAAMQPASRPSRRQRWVTYLRCHDDIGWAIDDADAARRRTERLRAPTVPLRLLRRACIR